MKDRFGFDASQQTGSFFWKRPTLGRRTFFRHIASAVGGYYLMPGRPYENVARAAATPINKAKKVIFVLMGGAPSHTDTFDLKVGDWTPASFNPTTYGDILFPQGLMPNIANQMDSVALVRSTRSWAAVHGLSQTWWQIGRNPTQALSKIAPHIGSVVAIEKRSQDTDKTLPAFVSLNTGTGPGTGYLPPENAPFYISPNGGGLPNASHPDGQPRFETRYALHQGLDAELMRSSPYGALTEEMVAFDANARSLMYNPEVAKIFTFAQDERNRYGNTSFGNACITARNLLAANKGTHFVQISIGGWDMHQNIYAPNSLPNLARQFDNGLGTLIADLKAAGTLDETLIIAMGEFGRTVGSPNQASGRDHFLQQTVLFAGGQIRGRRAIGITDKLGSTTVDPGWSRDRDVRPEDIEATIYSALGIDWTTVRRDDPTGRGFDYVPFASEQDLYGPIHELWS